MKNYFMKTMPIDAAFLGDYPDWTAFLITLLHALVLAVGVQESTKFNNIFTILNMGVVLFVVVAGFAESDIDNWKLDVASAKNATGKFSAHEKAKDYVIHSWNELWWEFIKERKKWKTRFRRRKEVRFKKKERKRAFGREKQ